MLSESTMLPNVALSARGWIVPLLVAWQVSPTVAAPARAREPSYCWRAGQAAGHREGGPEIVPLQGRPALLLQSAKRESVDLTAEYPWHALTGPWTMRIVFEATRAPQSKVPLVSKWHMTPGGRSWELGLLVDGRPYFDVSESGNWDARACELTGLCRIQPRQPYCLAAVFRPGQQIALYVNGQQCGTRTAQVPRKLHANSTPVLLGAQPPGQRWIDAAVAELLVDHRALTANEIRAWARSLRMTELPGLIESPVRGEAMDLAMVRRQVLDYCRSLQVAGRPYGTLRTRDLPRAPVTLYASCDVAWTRACMGENLTETLEPGERRQWIDHINSYARPDGTYENPNHGVHHRNGMVIGALAVLGGKQPYRVSLYDDFDEREEIGPWLEKIQWDRQWGASHLFWGGMHCFSMSTRCTRQWREHVFRWLDGNLDPRSGWWRKGVPQAGRHIEVLGGAAHIWPIYQHHGHRFPYPQQVIDSILAMQQTDGSWLGFSNYMELDALYGLAYMRSLAPDYRSADILNAARRHGRLVRERYAHFMSACPGTHTLLAVVGTLALLQELDPEHFQDTVRWSDIFSDRRFYATDRVEADG